MRTDRRRRAAGILARGIGARANIHLRAAVGLGLSVWVTRAMSSLLFGVSPTDGWVYASCGLLAVLAVMLASAGPAFRASRIDPVTVLRCE